jgi:hypothetical protein
MDSEPGEPKIHITVYHPVIAGGNKGEQQRKG